MFDMKRKLKIAGLSVLLVSFVSVIFNSASSGSVGFGFAVILSFFLSVFALVGQFFISLKQYRIIKNHFLTASKPVHKSEKELIKEDHSCECEE